MSSNLRYNGLEIAIIGISGQFPGSRNRDEFWQNIREGKDLLKTFRDDELRERGMPDSVLNDERFVKTIGVLDNKDQFDPTFFGYTPEEAFLMDPQIRLFHEHCWGAIEDSGYSSMIEKIRIGLFAGASVNENWRIYAYGRSADNSVDPFFARMIMSQNFIATLVSHRLNLRGPAIYIDTACSTSLTAVHLACRSLLTRDCSMALAGGISIMSEIRKGYFYQENMISSRDGRCRAFDASSSGTAWGEGAGVVVLKKLDQAIRDRDNIYAVIKATSANNDGSGKVGYTAPSVKGQAECISAAHKLAGVDPASISYVEAHGTGTRLGDPIEVRALNEAFATGGRNKFCAIGSVKTNIGHLDAAAGIAGLIKTALSLRYRQIPPSLHFEVPNPQIDFNGGPFYVNALLKTWEADGMTPLRAGVSSFGIGGTNVHAVLEEAPDRQETSSSRPFKLLTVSARTPASLARYLSGFREFLFGAPGIDLADMSYTALVGRKHFPCRTSIVYGEREELMRSLETGNNQGAFIKCKDKKNAVVFMFPGQGSQYANMSKDLYAGESFFREEMDRGFSILQDMTGVDHRAILFQDAAEGNLIDETRYTQPLLFLLEYSLARLLISYGIRPQYMIGHSIGEYAAACIGGVFEFSDALRLVVRRGELMNSLPGGWMISVFLSSEKVRKYLHDGVSLAAVNGPEQVVFSGDVLQVERLMTRLEADSVPFVKLHTSHAFHSWMQDGIMEAFRKEFESMTMHVSSIPFVSNLTGKFIRDEELLSGEYWVRHMRETVKFSDGMATLLLQKEELLFVEVGAGRALSALLKQQHSSASPPVSINMLRTVKEKEDDLKYFTGRLGQLWSHGVGIDWEAFYSGEKRNRISLPTYSFEPSRYPAEVDPFTSGVMAGFVQTQVQDSDDMIFYPTWRRALPRPVRIKREKKVFLFFSDCDLFSQSLKEEIIRGGDICIAVQTGDGYKKMPDGSYRLNPMEAGHFYSLARDLTTGGYSFTDLIYGWGMAINRSEFAWEFANPVLHQVYFSLVNILQALGKAGFIRGMRMVVLTDGLHKVIGTENGTYLSCLLLGLVNTIPMEFDAGCTNIDINLQDATEGRVVHLMEEIHFTHTTTDRVVAIRHGSRWVPDYLQDPHNEEKGKPTVKSGGLYLITGGLGNLGFVLATYLQQKYGAKLVLTGRSEVEAARVSGDAVSKSERLAFLKETGKDVIYIRTDITDLLELRTVVATIERTEGALQGVIHAAGVADGDLFELMENITIGNALKVFAPKAKGLENIYEVFKDRRPDFVWISSSLSTVISAPGFGAYSSANTYMDHFIEALPASYTGWKCLDLTGLAFSAEAAQRDGAALGPMEIIAIFEQSLSIGGNRVIAVNKGDLTKRIGLAYKVQVLADEVIDQPGPGQERPDLSAAYITAGTETEKRLKILFENLFGIRDLGVQDDFFELGGDSLKGMMLLKRINNEFGVNMGLGDFFELQTIRKIACYIDDVNSLFLSDISIPKKSVVI